MQKPSVIIEAFGQRKTIPEWSSVYGVPADNIWARLALGWRPERVVSEQVNRQGSRMTTADFIIRAKHIHGSRYRYSKSVYKTNKTPLTITCQEHGDFQQRPIHHFSGSGCPACGRRH